MGDTLTNFFNGGQTKGYGDVADAYGRSQNTASQYYNAGNTALNPYNQQGQSANNDFSKFAGNLQGDMNGNWMNGYQETPYAKFLTKQATDAANNSAAAGGVLGTHQNQIDTANLAENISSQDMQRYFENKQQQNQQYLGAEGDLANRGLSAATGQSGLSTSFGKMISDALQNQGIAQGLQDMAKQKGKNAGISDLFGGMDYAQNGGFSKGKNSGASGAFNPGAMASNYANA